MKLSILSTQFIIFIHTFSIRATIPRTQRRGRNEFWGGAKVYDSNGLVNYINIQTKQVGDLPPVASQTPRERYAVAAPVSAPSVPPQCPVAPHAPFRQARFLSNGGVPWHTSPRYDPMPGRFAPQGSILKGWPIDGPRSVDGVLQRYILVDYNDSLPQGHIGYLPIRDYYHIWTYVL